LAKQNKVLLDTSILLAVPENKARVFEGIEQKIGSCEFFVPSSVIRELEIVGSRKGRREDYNVVMELLKVRKVEEIADERNDADAFLEKQSKQGFLVATNDTELKKSIKGFGGRIIYLKKGTLIEIE